MEFKSININELKPAEYNPRIDLQPGDKEFEKIRKSIEEFGYVDPVIINKDGTIVGGHQRYKVLKDMGYTEIQCIVIDVDKEKEKALNIALNKISGDWDKNKLKVLLSELQGVGLAEITGFDLAELGMLGVQEEVIEDDFDIDKVLKEEKSYIQPGDIIKLGRHRLICGDSTNGADVEKLMNGKLADLVITDPPYNVNYQSNSTGMKIMNDNMEEDDFENFLYLAHKCMYDFSREGAPIYVFHSDVGGYAFRKAFIDAGYKMAECLIWLKNQFVLGRQDYQWRHEPILYGWKEGAGHTWYGGRSQSTILESDIDELKKLSKKELIELIEEYQKGIPTSVIEYERPKKNKLHPTMKPLGLLGILMQNSSAKGDIVLDLFGGSGSTLMTAERLDRTAYLVELDPVYCDAIVKRYIQEKQSSEEVIITRDNKEYKYNEIFE
jgi:DNA modification methylase